MAATTEVANFEARSEMRERREVGIGGNASSLRRVAAPSALGLMHGIGTRGHAFVRNNDGQRGSSDERLVRRPPIASQAEVGNSSMIRGISIVEAIRLQEVHHVRSQPVLLPSHRR
jgi:hypothetical protein